MNLKYTHIKIILKNILYTLSGTAVLAFGTALFIIPFNLVTGGVSGIAIAINGFTGGKLIPIDTLIAILSWSLFFTGLITLGKDFALKTFISTVFYPVFISLFSRLTSPDVMNGFFCLTESAYSQIAIVLASVFGGIFAGCGCAITFIGGGSTGGTDIIAFTICRFFKKLRSSAVIFATDAAVIILGMFGLGDFVLTLLGIVAASISATAVDKIFLGSSKAFVAQIISDNFDVINKEIIRRLERTATIIDVKGGYTGNMKKMLVVSFSIREYSELLNIVTVSDKNAFVTIQRAHEINGEGWTR